MKFLISNIRLLGRRFKSVAVINIVGLSVAFAVTLVVAKQLWYDLRYDRGFENSGSIHLVELDWGTGGGPRPIMNQQIPELWAERIPELQGYCLIGNSWGTTVFNRRGDATQQEESVGISFYYASKGFFDVFTPEIVAGDASAALLVPGHCIISLSSARAMFGTGDPVGNVIGSSITGDLVVDAVYRDFSANSSIGNGIYTMLAPEENSGRYNTTGYFMFPPEDLDRVVERVNDPAMLAEVAGGQYREQSYWFTELSRLHLHGGATGQGGQSRTMLYLAVIGLFVLVVAIINFINLSMAMAPARVRGVNIHRILGIGKGSLRASLAMESVLMAAAAVVAGGGIVYWYAGSALNDFFTAPLTLDAGIGLTVVIIALFLAIAFGVGLYSARYSSSFDVAIALKSSFALSRHGTRTRNTLIVIQFATAIFFICFSAAIKMQYDYMAGYEMGYEKENIVVLDGGQSKVSADVLTEELTRNSEIIDVTSSFDMPGAIGSFSGTNIKDKPVSYYTWTVAGNFLDFFGIEATPGRMVDGRRLYTREGVFASTMIVNREFMRRFDFTEQEMAEEGIGISEDVNFESLHEPVKPMAFTMIPEWKSVFPKIFVKITDNNVAATMKYIEDTWKTLSGATGVNATFLDDEIDNLYRHELGMSRLIGILGLVAVVIAIMGVYGLAAFNTRYKTREIAIRKVNGATIAGILKLLNRGMLTLVGVAFVLVVPITVWMVGRWIGAFAFRTSIPWWLYLAAGALVLLISVATVSWQSWRAANANPVKALISE